MRIFSGLLARFLNSPVPHYKPVSTSPPGVLRRVLRPGDVLLVEGNLRISSIIKYLTQSTWSHSAIYVGNVLGVDSDDPPVLIEADLNQGVIIVPLSKYETFHTRICRPIHLTDEDQEQIVDFLRQRIGHHYDMKNIFDLMRYLMPLPVPSRWRRRMLALGSGDPTRAICSTLIAQAFQNIDYPILPHVEKRKGLNNEEWEILHIRHHSLFTPRDFDVSPFFEVVKPTIKMGFDYKRLKWAHLINEPNNDE